MALGWVVGVACGLLAMFAPYHMAWMSYVYDAQEAALYNMLAPVMWSTFIGWIIFACYFGYAGKLLISTKINNLPLALLFKQKKTGV